MERYKLPLDSRIRQIFYRQPTRPNHYYNSVVSIMVVSVLHGIPDDFAPVAIPLPYRTGDVLGYIRGERFVGFYWDRNLGPVWDDGRPATADRSTWLSFVSVATRLQETYEVNLGSSDTESTHVLIWDRWRQKGYLALKDSALRFLRQRLSPTR